jgi:hypothetical protein
MGEQVLVVLLMGLLLVRILVVAEVDQFQVLALDHKVGAMAARV